MASQGRQRCPTGPGPGDLARLLQVPQGGRLRAQPVPGQRRHPRRRHPAGVHQARAERTHLPGPVQGLAAPDTRTGPDRNRSSSETRFPCGTLSSSRIACRSSPGTAASSVRYSSAIFWARVSATSRVSVVIPGNSTRSSTSHTTARSNRARGPSTDAHTRAARNARTSGSAEKHSR